MTKYSDHWLLLDAHVHIYDCYDLEKFFDAASKNFHDQAKLLNIEEKYTGILVLTESCGSDVFSILEKESQKKENINLASASAWVVKPYIENLKTKYALKLNKDGQNMIVVSGRQIISSEKIELLVLFTKTKYADGRPLNEILEQLNKENCIVVLPWGVGKWLGKRGKLLRKILQKFAGENLAIGDISGRPFFWPLPIHFSIAKQKNIKVISGTDPLPIKNEESKAGKYGSAVEVSDNRDVVSQLIKKLQSKNNYFMPYGRQESLSKFIINQLRIRLQ